MSNKNPENKRRDLVVLAALIEHPDAGLILFETGCAEDIDVVSLPSTGSNPVCWKYPLMDRNGAPP